MAAKKTQPKLRPIIHSSYSYLITKLYDSEYSLAVVSIRTLRQMVDQVKSEAETIFGGGEPIGLKYELEEVNYVLRRLQEMHDAGQLLGNEDVRVFGDSLKLRFNRFVKVLEEIDQDAE